jgi:hypothetical protein
LQGGKKTQEAGQEMDEGNKVFKQKKLELKVKVLEEGPGHR